MEFKGVETFRTEGGVGSVAWHQGCNMLHERQKAQRLREKDTRAVHGEVPAISESSDLRTKGMLRQSPN